jgi:uncharacterized protein involved in type VI secretion and phage assembly
LSLTPYPLPVTGSGVLPYQPRNAGRVTNEHLFAFHYRERLRPGTATLRDYNFKRPAQDLEGRHQGDSAAGLEVYDRGQGQVLTCSTGKSKNRIPFLCSSRPDPIPVWGRSGDV